MLPVSVLDEMLERFFGVEATGCLGILVPVSFGIGTF